MRLGLIVGTGDLPPLVARHWMAHQGNIHIIAFKGFDEPWISSYSHDFCGIAEVGKLFKILKSRNCDTVSFIGNVKRPDFAKLTPDLKGMSILPRIVNAARRGDDALLRAVVEIFESEGFAVIGVQELLEELVCGAEFIGSRIPDQRDAADIAKAFDIAGLIGQADIGQGSVVCEGLVLAVEAQEGTDEMLRRVGRLPENIRGTENARRGVLVKRPKPMQEQRLDLPVIGPSTIRLASEAGLSAVCGIADGALWVNRDEMRDLADQLGISLISLRTDGTLP